LTTVGLEVTSEETVKELEKRDVQIHDSIINILTSKTLPDLDDNNSRDSLKVEIKGKINKDLVTGRVLNVYFSKFIIQ
jgi:flagellar FliL protein